MAVRPAALPRLARTSVPSSTSGPLLVMPALWIVAAPAGATALELLAATVLSLSVGVTVPPKKNAIAPNAPASPVGDLTIVALSAISV